MPADAMLGMGCTVYYSTNGSSYTLLSDIETIGPPGMPKRRKIEVKLVAPTGDMVEYLSGLKEGGEFKFSQHYNKARKAALDLLEGDRLYWRVVIADAPLLANMSKVEFQGNLEEVGLSQLDAETPITIPCTVQVVTAPTFTAGV